MFPESSVHTVLSSVVRQHNKGPPIARRNDNSAQKKESPRDGKRIPQSCYTAYYAIYLNYTERLNDCSTDRGESER